MSNQVSKLPSSVRIIDALALHMQGMYQMESSNAEEFAAGCSNVLEANYVLSAMTNSTIALIARTGTPEQDAKRALSPSFMLPITVLLSMHHRAFVTSENEYALVDLINDFTNKGYEDGSLQGDRFRNVHVAEHLLVSLRAMRERTCPEELNLFLAPTDDGSCFEHLRGYDPLIKAVSADLVGVHVTEEASEVIKEAAKNYRNGRAMSVALITELADMQAMINIAMSNQDTECKQLLEMYTRAAENKKRLVLVDEVVRKGNAGIALAKLREMVE